MMKHWQFRAAIAALACTGVSGCGSWVEGPARALTSSGPFVQAYTTEELKAELAPHLDVIAPEGEGPFPAVIQFHGCGGLTGPGGVEQPIMREYAEAANSVGVTAVIVDSFAHREISREEALGRVCAGRLLRGTERASDVLAALDYVRDLEGVDADRIALAGWSHGGWAVMDLLSMDLENRRPGGLRDVPPDTLDGVRGAYLTYPYAGFFTRTKNVGWAWPVPARFVMAGEDVIAREGPLRRAIAAVFRAGVDVEVVEYTDATHGFDERFQEPDSSARFDPELTEKAHDSYAEWLQRTLIVQEQAEADGVVLFAARQVSSDVLTLHESEPATLVQASTAVMRYVVELGDTLWGIAQETLGRGEAYQLIYNANRDQITDPNVIFPGQTLDVPQQG